MGAKIVNAIRQAVGNLIKDDVKIFTGIVVDNTDAITNGVISVQQVSGKVVTKVSKDMNYSFNQTDLNADEITEKLNQQAGPLIFENVELQASPGDFFFVVPSLGSYVRVVYSTYQAPFVLQYSDADHTSTNFGNTTNTSNSNGKITIVNGLPDGTVGDDALYIQATKDLYATQLQKNTYFNQYPGYFAIGNKNNDLGALIQDLITEVKNLIVIGVPSGGGASTGISPTNLTNLTNIANKFSNLLH